MAATLGMGCSRLGSLLASGGADVAASAVAAALAEGIALFDTADIYGQGSSELILGRVLPRDGVEVCTKAGFVTPLPLWALRAIKPVLRPLTARKGGQFRGQVAARRARDYPQRFDARHLARSLQGSLRRLRRERVDVFLLHNPPPELAAQEGLWRWIASEQSRGRIGAFGISCMGLAADRVWLDHDAVAAAQIPASSVVPQPDAFVQDPRAARLRILVREIVGPGRYDAKSIAGALDAVARARNVSVALLGMSSPEHVRQIAGLFRGVAAA